MKRRSKSNLFLFKLGMKRTVSLLLTLMMLYGSVPAQTGTSSVRGSVLDQEGKAVAGATVTLKNIETNAVRTTTSKENGGYTFDLIQPGTYRLEVEASGFKKGVIDDVRALVDKPTTIDAQLTVGAISESVSVSAGSTDVLLNKQDATIGNNFQNAQITQLPLESRNVVALLSLQPGVTPTGYVTGSRSDQANVTLDGIDVNEQQTGLDNLTDEAFSSVLRVTPDSVQEFRVTTTNPNATQGRSSGAQVSLITKGGTNEFHGSLYEFHRNTATTANDFFNNRTIDPDTGQSIPRPKLIRNVFGGSLGGPIKKDRFFFFYNYEGRRDSAEQSVLQVVPLPSLGRGEVRFPNSSGGVTTLTAANINSIFPAVGVNPIGLAVLADAAARYPANSTSVGDGFNTGGFRFNAPIELNFNTNIVRFDYNLTGDARHLLFFRGNYQQDLTTFAPAFPDAPAGQFWGHPYGFVVGHTWAINRTLVNDLRYGLTRLAFTNFGDSDQNTVSFRFVFTPRNFTRTLSRTTPVHNFTDDVSWSKGSHSLQFGTNIRLIRNARDSAANAFDTAIANPSFYASSGAILTRPFASQIDPGFVSDVRSAVSAVIGRFSQYDVNFNYGADGNVLPAGLGLKRTFATEEYDFYAQDTWKLRQDLTLTLGLRYGLDRPVYETHGLQVKPTISLGAYFEQRKASSAKGIPFNDPIEVDLAGPANGRDGYYDWDLNNFQPRVAAAWTPSFKKGWLRKMFGSDGDAVIRGGFAMTNDHIGQQLAVQFDLNSTLGFTSNQAIAANTYNVTTNPAPRFTGFGQSIRALPGINDPGTLSFPLITPSDEDQRIESSLDDTIITPTNYSWNLSYGRQFKGGLFVEASYIGRRARNLLATRDIMALNNLTDPKSGVDWYTAATQLAKLRLADTPLNKVQAIPYFENLFPNLGDNFWGEPGISSTQAVYQIVARQDFLGQDFFDVLDWTFVQALIDDFGVAPNMFFHPQYAALSTFSTVGASDYHAGTLSIRERYKDSVQFDFNYTLSHSTDNASGLQTSGAYGAAFILNPLRPQDNKAASDFDIRHLINANALWKLPVGKGHAFLNDAPGFVDALLGGWQLTGIFRWNSGLPVQTPFDAAQWATNWNVQSNGVRVGPFESSPTRGGKDDPNLFSDPKAAYNAFRNAFPGETGDRNVLRLPGYVSLDAGLDKTFKIREGHQIQFRWEVFNVTNTQRLTLVTVTRSNLGLNQDSQLPSSVPGPSFGKLDGIQGSPRVMQFGVRYTF